GLVVVVALLTLGTSASAREPSKEDCIALNEHAQELERGGRLHDASELAEACSVQSCPVVLRKDCEVMRGRVSTAMPRVVFTVRADRAELHEVLVAVDGAPLAARLDGTALSVDPGEHTFEFVAWGHGSLVKKLSFRAGEG